MVPSTSISNNYEILNFNLHECMVNNLTKELRKIGIKDTFLVKKACEV